MNKLPATSLPTENITLLAVTPSKDDRPSLQAILDRDRWTVKQAHSIQEATALLNENPGLVLCEKDLPDGTWKDVFRAARGLDNPPAVVVVSRSADEQLWAEVLNVGAYDLLLRPFEDAEVSRVMGMAWRHSRQDARVADRA